MQIKSFKLHKQTINSPNELWLAIHLPLLPPVASISNNTDVSRVVHKDLTHKHQSTCNNASLKRNGTALITTPLIANILAKTEKVIDCNFESEKVAIEKLAKLTQSWSPKVVIHNNKLVLLEIGSSLRLHGGLTSLLKSVYKSFPRNSFGCNIAVTPTPASAILFAQMGYDIMLTNNLELASYLRQLSVQSLDLEKKEKNFLTQMGISQISDLLRLPKNGLTVRMGVQFLKKLEKITDKTNPQLIHKFSPYFEIKADFEREIYFIKPLLFQAEKFLAKLEYYLKSHRSSIDSFEWRLYRSDRSCIYIPIRLNRSRQEVKSLINLTKIQFESKLSLKCAIIQLALHVNPVPISVANNISFLQIDKLYESEQLLNRLYLRLGYSAVKVISCKLDHRPEHAWTKTKPGIEVHKDPSINRPLWLFNKPKPLLIDRRNPIFHGALELSKHERIVTSWWDDNPIQRDYYLAKSNQGLIWIFRELKNSKWYMHGLF